MKMRLLMMSIFCLITCPFLMYGTITEEHTMTQRPLCQVDMLHSLVQQHEQEIMKLRADQEEIMRQNQGLLAVFGSMVQRQQTYDQTQSLTVDWLVDIQEVQREQHTALRRVGGDLGRLSREFEKILVLDGDEDVCGIVKSQWNGAFDCCSFRRPQLSNASGTESQPSLPTLMK
jgi:hypothetical protein